MAYGVIGEAKYLQIIKNAYDFFQDRQCYATGGYGPAERILPTRRRAGQIPGRANGYLRIPCGSWAAFKLSRYLIQFTGEARYGDWIERLFYNGIGAALPMKGRGTHMYYWTIFWAARLKYYSRNAFPCCSGTYFQNIAEYSNLAYFRDAESLYVNLYLPSEAEWKGPAGTVKVVQTTQYPETGSSTLKLSLERPALRAGTAGAGLVERPDR